jgi:cytochrome o ubiquinol oxidase subunit 1
MGATRRLDHYSASLGWQPLFIVSGIGAGIIAIGVGIFVLQIALSIIQRKDNIDYTGDPWNGRTLEWSIPSPAPFYNFAISPIVHDRDPFWEAKRQSNKDTDEVPHYKDIVMPKNSGIAPIIGMLSVAFGFGMIWHVWWLCIAALVTIIVVIIVRSSDDHTEFIVPAKEIERIETEYAARKAQAPKRRYA